MPEPSVRNFLNLKAVLDVGLCRLWNLSARRLHVDLADFAAPVQGVTPPASPAVVIGVPDAACLRNVAAPLAETNWRAPRLRGHHFLCAGRDLHEIAVLAARSRCSHPISREIGAELTRARQFRFEEFAAAVLSLTDRGG